MVVGRKEVDWTMKTSCPRTFSWISTKTSMSAKRRTWPLVSGSAEIGGNGLGKRPDFRVARQYLHFTKVLLAAADGHSLKPDSLA